MASSGKETGNEALSGGSTMTRRMDESFSIMPGMKSNLNMHAMKDAANRLDANA